MGWTSFTKPENVADWVRKTLTWENGNAKRECLDVAIVQRRTAYAAVRVTHADGTTSVCAAVFLLKFTPNDKEGFTFTYKDLSEDMGPTESDCPARILDRLTPTDNKYANEWRQRCRERLARRANNALKPGDYIRFPHPLRFTGHGGYDTFRFEPIGRRPRFMAVHPENGLSLLLCKIRDWREREFVRLEGDDIPGARQAAAPRM